MHVFIDDNPHLREDLSEDDISDIFDHHGWKVLRLIYDPDHQENLPIQHEVEGELRGLSSRGHPLYIGSPEKH